MFMKRNKVLIILICLIAILAFRYILVKPAFNYIAGYLSKSNQVKSNILVVEGWLPEYALEMAYDEYNRNGYDYVVTTGLKYSAEYYQLNMNGYLIFSTKDILKGFNNSEHHLIEINAYSELGGKHSAHFNFFVNNLCVADFNAEKHKQLFPVSWVGSLNDIDSVMVQFTNDAVGSFGDINLYVKEIIIDHKIKIPFQNNSEFNIGVLARRKRVITNFTSYAELAKNRLLSMGIASSQIISIPCNRVKINRTLTSALAFRDWLKTTNIDVKGINIMSMGTHARRTWMTYNKILDEKYNIGIISLPDYGIGMSQYRMLLKTLRETAAIIYYWFILIPY
jgi:hypothetical protein